jgi:hypothetical protein
MSGKSHAQIQREAIDAARAKIEQCTVIAFPLTERPVRLWIELQRVNRIAPHGHYFTFKKALNYTPGENLLLDHVGLAAFEVLTGFWWTPQQIAGLEASGTPVRFDTVGKTMGGNQKHLSGKNFGQKYREAMLLRGDARIAPFQVGAE